MALTSKQIDSVIKIFTSAFIRSESYDERKKLVIEFEDTLGKSMEGWMKLWKH